VNCPERNLSRVDENRLVTMSPKPRANGLKAPRVMFYVIKERRGYVVYEATPEDVFMRTKDDPMLTSRMDREPFMTRATAERRCNGLNDGSITPPGYLRQVSCR
jgi:hypothetical protein